MRRILNALAILLCAIAITMTPMGTADAATTISKSQYISLWTAACVAGGKSSKLKLSDGERNNIFLVRPFLESYRSTSIAMGTKSPSASTLIRKACGCMANYIASRKPNVMALTSRSLADAATNKCLLS